MDDPSIAAVFDPKHHSRFIQDLHDFFTHQTLTDVCFICKNGQKVKAHQMVLSVVSKLLKKIFLEFAGTGQDIVIHLPDVSASSLKLVLFFLYEGGTRLAGVAEYQEFQSVLNLLGIQPDNNASENLVSASTPQTIQQTPQSAISAPNYPLAVEAVSNPPYSGNFASQGLTSTNEYHPCTNQPSIGFVPGVSSSQQQMPPYKIMNEVHQPEPGRRNSTDYMNRTNAGPSNNDHSDQLSIANQLSPTKTQKRKQVVQNPNPAKQPNMSIKREHIENNPNVNIPSRVNTAHESSQVITTADITHVSRPNQSGSRGNTNHKSSFSESKTHRGRGRPSISSGSRTPISNVSSVSRRNSKSSGLSTDDCVVLND